MQKDPEALRVFDRNRIGAEARAEAGYFKYARAASVMM